MSAEVGRAYDRDTIQRHTVRVLTGSQALGGLGMTVGIAVAAVLAEDVSGSDSLAGLAQTFQVLGAAAGSYLIARVMGQRGRRPGLVAGYLIGAAGALLVIVGGAGRIFPVILAGTFLLGSTSAANNQSRYAAVDLASPAHRARALSIVVWATTIGAVLGPNLTGPSGDLAETLGLPRLTGPFLFALVVMLLAGAVVATWLRPDPLLVARELDQGSDNATHSTSWGRVRQVLATRPAVVAGIVAISSAHAVMTAVMVMTPLHMHHGGADLEIIGFVISMHVLGMFAFAPIVGIGADRLGRAPVLGLGAAVLLAALVLAGTSPAGASWRIGLGLFLLGVGWSLSTVAGSTLLSEETPIEARTDVQGAADLVMNLAAAAAGALGGLVVDHWGFGSLNVFAAVLVAGVVVAVPLGGRRAEVSRRREPSPR
ncbi:MAG: MFS transporter [Nocardioidaceae bacterium]